MSKFSNEPVSAEACEAIGATERRLEKYPNRELALGSMPITRILPVRDRRLVGPWCFLDRFGPLSFTNEKPMDVAPHPHIGLQTVTWLLAGEVVHDDSLGSEAVLRPSGVNVMTSGRRHRARRADTARPHRPVERRAVVDGAAGPHQAHDRGVRPRPRGAGSRVAWRHRPRVCRCAVGRRMPSAVLLGDPRSRPAAPRGRRDGHPAEPGLRARGANAGRRRVRGRSTARGPDALLPGHDTHRGARQQPPRRPPAPHRRAAVSRNHPDVVELRRAHARRDRRGARRLGSAPPLRRRASLRRASTERRRI